MPATSDIALHFFLQLGLTLLLIRIIWPVMRRLGQVQVVAMMVAGFLLGPSVFGLVAPSWQAWLFPLKVHVDGHAYPHPGLFVLYTVGQLGLVIYMFMVGMSFDTRLFARHISRAVGTSLTGVSVPLVLGGLVGWLMLREGGYFIGDVNVWQAVLFLGAAVAISAFPMLAWIIHESGLQNTRLGTIALACAAADDVVSWVLLAGVVASVKGSSSIVVTAVVGGIGYLVVMITVGRAALSRLGQWADQRAAAGETLPMGALLIPVIVMLLGAWFTDWAGVYSVFGAFVAGCVMPRGYLTEVLSERLNPFATVLLPVFFVYSGLNTKLSLFMKPEVLLMLGIVLVVSVLGKGVAVAATARLQGVEPAEAYSLGALMNARGLMELVLLTIGLNAGFVSTQLYTVLAIMAIVTTLAASPLHEFFSRRVGRPDGSRTTDERVGEPDVAGAGTSSLTVAPMVPDTRS